MQLKVVASNPPPADRSRAWVKQFVKLYRDGGYTWVNTLDEATKFKSTATMRKRLGDGYFFPHQVWVR